MSSSKQNPAILHESFENYFGYQLRRVAAFLHADLTHNLKELALIPTTAFIMLVLANNKNIIQIELSRKLGLKRTNISPLIIGLEKRGLLSRSSLDGRSQNVELTDQGSDLIKKIQSRIDRHEKSCFSRLTSNEFLNLEKVVRQARENLDPKLIQTNDSELTQYLGYQIVRVSSLAMNQLLKVLAPLEMIPSTATVLLVIAANPGIIQIKIGRELGIKRANISKMIRDFNQRKLLDVEKQGRTQSLSLSEEGQALIKPIEKTLADHERNSFNQLKDVNLDQALQSLRSIRQQIEK